MPEAHKYTIEYQNPRHRERWTLARVWKHAKWPLIILGTVATLLAFIDMARKLSADPIFEPDAWRQNPPGD